MNHSSNVFLACGGQAGPLSPSLAVMKRLSHPYLPASHPLTVLPSICASFPDEKG